MNSSIKNKNIYFLVIFLLLFLLSAFRNGLGTDYSSYAETYTNPTSSNSFSILFKLIFIYGLRLISSNYIVFFIVTAFITNYLVIKKIYDESSIIAASVVIYIFFFYLSTFNLVRQFLALSLFFYYGLELIQKNKINYYIILLIIIAQIHFSIYILILFLLFKDEKKSIFFYLTLWSISIIFVLFKDFQVAFIVNTLKILAKIPFAPKGITIWSEHYSYFLDLGKSNLQLWMKNILLIILFLSYNKFNERKSILYLNLLFFGIILGNFLNLFSQLGNRIAYYGEFAFIFVIPDYINMYKSNVTYILLIFILTYFISLGFYRFYLKDESQAIPNRLRINKVN